MQDIYGHLSWQPAQKLGLHPGHSMEGLILLSGNESDLPALRSVITAPKTESAGLQRLSCDHNSVKESASQ